MFSNKDVLDAICDIVEPALPEYDIVYSNVDTGKTFQLGAYLTSLLPVYKMNNTIDHFDGILTFRLHSKELVSGGYDAGSSDCKTLIDTLFTIRGVRNDGFIIKQSKLRGGAQYIGETSTGICVYNVSLSIIIQ